MSDRLAIATDLLGCVPEMPGGYAPCPGIAHHSKGNGKRDFRVVLDGAPTGYCFHAGCTERVEGFNRELRSRIWRAEHDGRDYQGSGEPFGAGISAPPRSKLLKRPPVDEARVRQVAESGPRLVDAAWLRRHSPVDVRGLSSGDFLNAVFRAGERVLVFLTQYSQGDFCWWVGHGGFRLSPERGVKAAPSAMPTQGPEGVWYLVQPVTGAWTIKPKDGEGQWSRRAEGNVTSWRHFVIESDEVAPELWLRVLVQLPLPIAAIYTSGGRSIHALVRCEVSSKACWDATRDAIRQLVCPLGADAAALTAVRLSRLPGCKRGKKEQELLYLNPAPETKPIMLLPEQET